MPSYHERTCTCKYGVVFEWSCLHGTSPVVDEGEEDGEAVVVQLRHDCDVVSVRALLLLAPRLRVEVEEDATRQTHVVAVDIADVLLLSLRHKLLITIEISTNMYSRFEVRCTDSTHRCERFFEDVGALLHNSPITERVTVELGKKLERLRHATVERLSRVDHARHRHARQLPELDGF